MPVIIAHGQPKSGSTFLFQTVLESLSIIEGDLFYRIWAKKMGEGTPVFFGKVDLESVREVQARAGSNILVMKTHSVLPDEVRELIERGEIRAFTSFRDPRDACRSMLDAGISDRAKGVSRWFATKTKAEELIRPIGNQVRDMITWLDCPAVLAVPYYITANNQDFAVVRLCEHLGFRGLGRVMAGIMQANKTAVPEFHKGVSDRFLTDFNWSDIQQLNAAMSAEIRLYEEILGPKMKELHHHMLCQQLVRMREERLAAMARAAGA